MYFSFLLDVAYHVVPYAHITWEPWTDPTHSYIGWQGKPHNGGDDIFVYLVVDLDAIRPTIRVHAGPAGDPRRDPEVAVVQP